MIRFVLAYLVLTSAELLFSVLGNFQSSGKPEVYIMRIKKTVNIFEWKVHPTCSGSRFDKTQSYQIV